MAQVISYFSLAILVALLSFVGGMYAAHKQALPYNSFLEAVNAIDALRNIREASRPPDLIEQKRRPDTNKVASGFSQIAEAGPRIVLSGGIGEYKEACGEPGCLAVMFDRSKAIVHKWPLKPEQLVSGPALAEGDHAYGGRDKLSDITIVGLDFFNNGDLLVSTILRNAFPYGYGLARIDPNGDVVWRRRDFTNHWPRIGHDGKIYTPLHEIRTDYRYESANSLIRGYLRCKPPEKQYADFIEILDADGKFLKKFDLIDLFAHDKRFSFVLTRTTKRCDPLHLNYIDVADNDDSAAVSWIDPGDMLVSFRNISAVAIISADGKRIKNVITGKFSVQHSAQFTQPGKIALFDNAGVSAETLPSRVVEIDLNTLEEKVVFARPKADALAAELSMVSGDIAYSQKWNRYLVAYTNSGRVNEIDASTGQVVSRFENFHVDPKRKENSGLYKIFGASYPPESWNPTTTRR